MKRNAARYVSFGLLLALACLAVVLVVQANRQAHLNAALMRAVNAQNAVRVNALLAEGADPNSRDLSYRSPPWYSGLLYVLHLRKRPAFHVYPDPTALMLAAYNCDVATVRALLAHGANANLGGRQNIGDELVPLGDALEGSVPYTTQGFANGPNSLQIISLLLAHGADANGLCLDVNHRPCSFLGMAAGMNQTDAALILLLHGANPNKVENALSLNTAVSFANFVLVKSLLAHGANVDKTHIIFDIPSGDNMASFQIGQILIAKGADINARNDAGETPLLVDERTHDMRLLAFLMKAGADPNIKDDQGQTALTYGSPDEVALIRALQKPGTPLPRRLLAGKRRIIMYATSF